MRRNEANNPNSRQPQRGAGGNPNNDYYNQNMSTDSFEPRNPNYDNNQNSFLNNYLDESSYYERDHYEGDPSNRSPYYSSDSSLDSPHGNRGHPQQPSPVLDAELVKGDRGRDAHLTSENYYPDVGQSRHSPRIHRYADSEADSMARSDIHSNRSSIIPNSQSGYAANLDLFGAIRNPKLSDSRYARYAPSTESLLALIESRKPQFGLNSVSSFSRASSWVSEANGQTNYFDLPGHRSLAKDYPWPAWCAEHQVPLSKEEIFDIFSDLGNKFGFQKDSVRNQYDAFMTLLDSRASRMSPTMALLTLHADYIGGKYSNYRKWYFAAEFNKDSPLQFDSQNSNAKDSHNTEVEEMMMADSLEEWWRNKMSKLTQHERVLQIALYLLIWGEALNIRYLPEVICFLYKLAYDYYHGPICQNLAQPVPEGEYLRNVVTPLYLYIRDQNYEVVNGQFLKRERDHAQVVGYDDINETFWTKEGVNRLVLEDKKTKLMSIHPHERWTKLGNVNYKRSFIKTYYERRTWAHTLTNFSRIWIFHLATFYIFWVYNSPVMFYTAGQIAKNNKVPNPTDINPRTYGAIGFGGAIAAWIALSATFFEFFFVQRCWKNYRILMYRYFMLFLVFIANVAPGAASIILYNSTMPITSDNDSTTEAPNKNENISKIIGIVGTVIAIFTTAILTTIPPSSLFVRNPRLTLANSSKNGIINRAFTADFSPLSFHNRATSLSMWACIGIAKIVESYLALILSFKNPMNALFSVATNISNTQALTDLNIGWGQVSDPIIGVYIVNYMPYITIAVMALLLLIMFFLDTYLWYIIMTSMFSIAHAFTMGISILSPWKNIFSRLPKRIYTKILATTNMEIKLRPKMLCSQVWNAIVISMYRDHLISIDHVQKLLYQQVASDVEGKKKLKPPTFFVAQEDTKVNAEFYPPGSEAERRISFFASSLSTVIPEPLPVENMPTFTVFTPHYAEKILLSLREIIREDDQFTRVTMLEYLKSLYSVEWDNFVKDTKILAEENSIMSEEPPSFGLEEDSDKATGKVKTDDLPFYCIGFKSAAPEFTLRTRIWASLRSQTLYRTISGFMNYSKALKLLHRIENPELVHILGGNTDALEQELDLMSRRKFNFVISMQRFTKFNKEEKENVEFLLKTYPDLQIAYLDEEPSETEGEPPTMFSCLIDGHCEQDESGVRTPRYRIQIPGNPILGDGKSDNQNHAIIFTRGEYLQVIDANQDNYLEEALKIRSVLAEFDEYIAPPHSPYAPPSQLDQDLPPVAIIGAREYIFSENIGILGDIAAGKEQTFGTLTHRIMATIGGRLHYGHPDFLNMIFMNTRGGVSKAQKGLHLNEDIYAGMNAFQRGGRIKHSEYIQCGKGRDLGFCSVLNFNTKIGTGMGEQLLSREYYYIYSQLPLDRFLTLFYAHPGFHINNMMIMFSIQVFLLAIACTAVLYLGLPGVADSVGEDNVDFVPENFKFNQKSILGWIQRTILSVFLVFFITFLPLILQVLSEQGFSRMASRLGKQIASLAPMFEIFTTQIYSHSILSNLSFGGARYIGTGRGFATTRQSFATLYSRFASSSIYSGMRSLLLLMFCCVTMFTAPLLYFWFTCLGLILSPWLYNPHQFSLMEFILDYRNFLHWMSAGNSSSAKDSWIAHCRYARTRITGQKRKKLGDKERKIGAHVPRANRLLIFISEVLLPFLTAIFLTAIYSCLVSFSGPMTHFLRYPNSQFVEGNEDVQAAQNQDSIVPYSGGSGIVKVLIVAVVPIALNAGILLVLFPVSLFLGPVMSMCAKSFGGIIAAIAHAWAVLNLVICFIILWFLENWKFGVTLLGLTASMFLQRAIFSLLMFLFLTREFGHDGANVAWWTGKWVSAGLGWMAVTQPAREFVCKIVELSLFATDYIAAHLIWFMLAPFALIPLIDKWHSMMLFWLRPSKQIRPPIFSLRQRAQRRRASILYGILFVVTFVFFLVIIVGPLAIGNVIAKSFSVQKIATMGAVKNFAKYICTLENWNPAN